MIQARPDLLHSDVNSAAFSAPAAALAGPLSISTQYHAQDGQQQYTYGYFGGLSAKVESKTADGVTRGRYSYIDSNGIIQSVSYVSDPVNGFRVAATNLPSIVATPVTDTPEVAAAKVAHSVAFNEAAAAAAASPDVPEAVVPEVSASLVVAAAPAVPDPSGVPTAPAVPAASAVLAASAKSAAPASSAADAPPVVTTHTYTAPGILASANTAGTFSYSVHSIGPTYSPAFYSAVLPAATPILINELLTDTPEIAAAKAAHFAAHVEAKQRLFG
jgi:hypothetical protein